MSWLISLVLASALFTTGSAPVSQIYENQNSRSFTRTDETERIDQTYPFSPSGKIEVSNVNGSITIDTWDNPQIKLEAVKIAGSRERLADLEIKINAGPDNFRVEADYGNWKNKNKIKWDKSSNLVVNFRLTVPRAAVLDEIQTVNGSVSISNSTSFTRASAVNGQVKGVNLRGNAELSTVNGTVEADFDQLQTGSMISLSTVNGKANLIIPSDADATLRVESLNGEIINDFGLPVRKGKYVGRDLYGKIGTGDVKIKLDSVNGDLAVKRKSDGKALNPAIDLLPQKSAGDDDDDFEFDFDNDFEATMRQARRDLRQSRRGVETARREIEKAAKITRVEVEKAAVAGIPDAEAIRVEVEKMAPELAKISEEALKEAVAALDSAEIRANISAARREKAVKAVTADERFPWRSPFLEEKSGSYQVKGTPGVKIETVNCSVSVRGWEKPEVKYSMSKVASNVAQKPVEFSAAQPNAESVEIKVINQNGSPGGKFSNPETTHVHLEVFVPKKSNLQILTNDEVRLEGVTGDIDLQGGGEAVNIRDTGGKLDLKADDAIVRVIGFTGEIESALGGGEMFLEGDFQKIRASAGGGTIVLTLPDKTDASVTADTDSVESDGIELIPESGSSRQKSRWRIGKGGKDFDFDLDDGALFIRSRDGLIASF